jgi:hypothetical protein
MIFHQLMACGRVIHRLQNHKIGNHKVQACVFYPKMNQSLNIVNMALSNYAFASGNILLNPYQSSLVKDPKISGVRVF